MLPLLANSSLTLSPGAAASVNGQLSDASGGTRLRISNNSANLAYYRLGKDNTVVADTTTASIPIPGNQTIEVARRPGAADLWIAVFSTLGTTVVIAAGTTANS
jgi:hypothetical protein